MVQIMCTDRPDLEEVVLMGYTDETRKARDFIQDIVNKVCLFQQNLFLDLLFIGGAFGVFFNAK